MPSDFTTKTLHCLPSAYRSDPWLIDLLEAIKIEYNAQNDTLTDIYAQFFIDSMTWHLADEELEAGLLVRPASPLENRRAVVKAKWRGAEKCDISLIRDIVKTWKDTEPIVSYDGKRFHIAVSFFAEKVDLPALIRQLRETIPAHLFMTATAKTYPVQDKIFIGGAQIGMMSRMTLPLLEPQQDFSATLALNPTFGGIRSRTDLETLEAEQDFSTEISLNYTKVGDRSRVSFNRLE